MSKQMLDNVHILVGRVDQIVEDRQMQRARFGIAYSTVNEAYMDTLAPVLLAYKTMARSLSMDNHRSCYSSGS